MVSLDDILPPLPSLDDILPPWDESIFDEIDSLQKELLAIAPEASGSTKAEEPQARRARRARRRQLRDA
jgi:hypothetical protein